MARRPMVTSERKLLGIVPVDHPALVQGTQRALRRGYPIGEIVKRTGMPYEEVAKLRDRLK